jgi:hypothetical protein
MTARVFFDWHIWTVGLELWLFGDLPRTHTYGRANLGIARIVNHRICVACMSKPERTAASIGRRNRQRGQEGEREVCAILTDNLGRVIKRALGQERDKGTDILEVPPFAIEVKRRSKIALLYEAIAQAHHNESVVPVVALRADGKGWLVTMRLQDWCKLAREEIAK